MQVSQAGIKTSIIHSLEEGEVSWLDLPPELWLRIFRYFEPATLQRTTLINHFFAHLSGDYSLKEAREKNIGLLLSRIEHLVPRILSISDPSNNCTIPVIDFASQQGMVFREGVENGLKVKLFNQIDPLIFDNCGYSLARQQHRSFYTSNDLQQQQRLMILDHRTWKMTEVNLTEQLPLTELPEHLSEGLKEAYSQHELCQLVSCIPVSREKFVTVTQGGFITAWELSEKGDLSRKNHRQLFNFMRDEIAEDRVKFVKWTLTMEDQLLVFGEGFNPFRYDLLTHRLKPLYLPADLQKHLLKKGVTHYQVAVNSSSLFFISDESILRRFSLQSDGQLVACWSISLPSSYRINQVNEKWIYCSSTQGPWTSIKLFQIQTGHCVWEEIVSTCQGLHRIRELCGDVFLSWTDVEKEKRSQLQVRHIPTKKASQIDLQKYLPEAKEGLVVRQIKLIERQLTVVARNDTSLEQFFLFNLQK